MSKVNPKYLPKELQNSEFRARRKEALRRSNRRYETRKKKEYRMRRVRNNHRCYYGIIDSRPIRETVERVQPKRVEPIYEVECVSIRRWDWETSSYYYEPYNIYHKVGETIIPERVRRWSRIVGETPIKPYLCKYDDGKYKKWYRNQAARKVRRSRSTEPLQRGGYKKEYDLWWALY